VPRLPSKSASKPRRRNDRRRIRCETRGSPSRICRSSWAWPTWAGPPGNRPARAGGARGTRRRWAGGGIRLHRRRTRLVRFGAGGSCRASRSLWLRNHNLPAHRDVCERVGGGMRRMLRDHMSRSALHQADRGDARGGETEFRFPGKELPECLRKERPHMPGMAPVMPHVAPEAAVSRGTMHQPMPRGASVRGQYPRRRTQDSNTAEDQQVAHPASSRDSQAHSPFLFEQATGLPCKFDLKLVGFPTTEAHAPAGSGFAGAVISAPSPRKIGQISSRSQPESQEVRPNCRSGWVATTARRQDEWPETRQDGGKALCRTVTVTRLPAQQLSKSLSISPSGRLSVSASSRRCGGSLNPPSPRKFLGLT
jgi:hypothetical protein